MKFLNAFILLACLLMMNACDPEEEAENEEELITTIVLTLTPVAGGNPIVMSYKDLDGPGAVAPTVVAGVLDGNKEYSAKLQFKNESVTPAVDITQEIIAEGVDHQVFFAVSQPLLNSIRYTYKDLDGRGRPIGIETSFFTKAAAKGDLAIILRHKPNKDAAGAVTGNSQSAGGDSDVDITIPLEVK
jgi:hypothetical protein